MKPTASASLPKFSDKRVLIAAGIVAFVLLAAIGVSLWPHDTGEAGSRSSGPGGAATPGEAETASNEVQLTVEKFDRAGLKMTKAERRPFRETRAVPGQIAYDGAKYLSITAPVDGVVKRVLAEPGQMVEQGTPLVVMSSTEIGLARDEVLRRIVDLELADYEHRWAMEIAENVDKLLKWLPERPKLAEIEARLNDHPLGDYREQLISAYSKLLLAEQVLNSSGDLDQQGALARRVIEERRSNREVATATFLSACETARFNSHQAHRKSHAAFTQARRLVGVARERLAALLGPQADALEAHVDDEPPTPPGGAAEPTKPGESVEGKPATPPSSTSDLSQFTISAPFSGRIEDRSAVVAARVRQGDSLFDMADTTTLWVEAEIHERNWKALQHVNDATIPVRVPALNDAAFTSTLRFIGSKISPVSRSVPLVTELANPDGVFKPGMFVWVDVPLEVERQALVVPAGAVMRHEGQAFVFVPRGERKFLRVDVETGLESGAVVEILRGLEPGQEIVESGVFYLKSELLLEREVE